MIWIVIQHTKWRFGYATYRKISCLLYARYTGIESVQLIIGKQPVAAQATSPTQQVVTANCLIRKATQAYPSSTTDTIYKLLHHNMFRSVGGWENKHLHRTSTYTAWYLAVRCGNLTAWMGGKQSLPVTVDSPVIVRHANICSDYPVITAIICELL